MKYSKKKESDDRHRTRSFNAKEFMLKYTTNERGIKMRKKNINSLADEISI